VSISIIYPKYYQYKLISAANPLDINSSNIRSQSITSFSTAEISKS